MSNFSLPVLQAMAELKKLVPGLTDADISFVNSAPRTWSDSSMDLRQPGYGYAQVITLGDIITLKAKDTEYIFHVSGATAKLASPQPSA